MKMTIQKMLWTGVMIGLFAPITQAASTDLYINNELQKSVEYTLEEGTMLVPLRVISERLGCQIQWISEEQKIIIQKDDTKIELELGKHLAYINGVSSELDIAPMSVNDTTMVPLRFITEALESTVIYDSVHSMLFIYEKDIPIDKIDTSNWKVSTYKHPLEINNKLFVPQEFVIEAFNATYESDGSLYTEDKIVWISDEEGPYHPQVNYRFTGDTSDMLEIVDGKPYYPLEYLCEHLNAYMTYNQSLDEVRVVYRGVEEIPLTDEKIHTVKGYVRHTDGTPAENARVSFRPASASGDYYKDSYYSKYELEKIEDVYTDKDGYYEFKDINIEDFPFASIKAEKIIDGEIHNAERSGGEVLPELLNNVEQLPMSSLKYNLRRLEIPTLYIRFNPWKN